ncbi:MAG: PAS domain-containing protein [Deltaproteobacteria bacterium]|nr:PAS domain-containing protein [Deltaproteobacteria bacterium]
MLKRKRLLWQLYPSYLLITFLSLMAAIWFSSRTLRQSFLDKYASDLESRALLAEAQIHDYLSPQDNKNIERLCEKIGHSSKTRITVILPSGLVIGDSEEDYKEMDNHLDRPEVLQASKGQVGVATRYSLTLQKDMMYVAVPINDGPGIIGILRTSIPLTSIDRAIKRTQMEILMGGLLIAVFAAIISLLVSRRISRPIEEIRRGAESFSRGEFQCRLPLSYSYPEEIGALSETMNKMAAELNEKITTIVQQRNELEAVFSSMVEGVLAVDREERIVGMNYAAAQIFSCNPNDVQGRTIQEAVRNIDLQKFVMSVLSNQNLVEKDIVLHSTEERVLNGHGTALLDADGNSIGALIVLNDVTRVRKLENIRKDFVANVSHEIKTPVTAIKGFVETLRDGAMKNLKDADRFLGIIERHVNRLEAIVEDLLSLSRIEQEAEDNVILRYNGQITDVLVKAIQLCEIKASTKKIHVELSCDENLKAEMNHELLEQAVVNLIDNAIKYSDEEGVVRVEATQKDGEILIEVIDQGCGIEKKYLSRIFERFYRVDKGRSRKLGGTGLGLAIVKHILQAHGGRVTVESSPLKGSTFCLHLPKYPPHPP